MEKTTGGATTYYLWDGDQLLAEYDGSGNRQVRYAYSGGFAPSQAAYDDGLGGETVYHVHTDHLDTPRLLTDASSAAAWRATYSAFGEAQLDSGNSVTFNVRFPGQYWDDETQTHYNRHRYYDPSTGRYVSADPIGQVGLLANHGVARSSAFAFGSSQYDPIVGYFAVGESLYFDGTTNLYGYVLNDPLNLFDPLGLYPGEQYVNFALGAGDAVFDFGNAFGDQFMATNWQGRAHNGWAGQDKYFHCRANCQAAQRGAGGAAAAGALSDAREGFDQMRGASAADCQADQAANAFGRAQGAANPGADCRQLCSKYRPGGSFPSQF